jgi:hypothetical protein
MPILQKAFSRGSLSGAGNINSVSGLKPIQIITSQSFTSLIITKMRSNFNPEGE